MLHYVEPSFQIIYLVLGLIVSVLVIIKSRKRPAYLILASMGLSMVLCDAMSYIPRMIGDWCFQINEIYRYMGIGRTGISVSMTVLYTLIYVMYRIIYKKRIPPFMDWVISIFVVVRIGLFLIPTDGLHLNQNYYLLAVLEKIPYMAIGLLIVFMLFKRDQFINKTYFTTLEYILLGTIFAITFTFDIFGKTYIPLLFISIPLVVLIYAISFIGYRSIKKQE